MDLKTTYLGMELKNPIVPSASPLSQDVASIKRLEDQGAAAVVMFSLFEEQLRQDAREMADMLSAGTDSFAEALSYFPEVDDYAIGPDQYLSILSQASEQTDIPIIASLNGITSEGWVDYAKQMQDAGAKAIELNIYYIPTDLRMSGAEVEDRYVDVLAGVKGAVTVPVALKLSPFFSSMAHMANRFATAGADGLVLFNRFYQPDFDLDSLQVSPTLSLSTPNEIRLPLLWIAILKNKVNCSLAATSGVHSAQEAIKFLMAGADVVQTASALLNDGPKAVARILEDMQVWMAQKDYESVAQMKGAMSQEAVADPDAFERANYIKILEKYKAEYVLEG